MTNDPNPQADAGAKLADSVTLDVNQIRELCRFVGADDPDTDGDTLIVVAWRDNVTDDDGNVTPPGHVAWFDDYPEEGCYPLSTAEEASAAAESHARALISATAQEKQA